MGLKLFDDITRGDPSPATGEEDSFAFMNRVDSPYWAEVRRVLELWFGHYPSSGALDLRNRFRSRKPGEHWGAWWELYQHEVWSSLGFEVTPHPALPDTDKRPDFLVCRGDFEFYVEASVVFSGIVSNEPTTPAWLLDAINLVQSPNFFVYVGKLESAGKERLKNSQVARPIQNWLETLDPDQVKRQYEATEQLPSFVLSKRGWRLHLEASPVRPDARGEPGHRVLGGGPAIAGMVDDVQQLYDKLKAKAGRYGRPLAPFITAVLCLSSFMEDQDIAQALFGRDAYQFPPAGSSSEPELIRQRNGFWMHESGPTNRRVSAVLTAVQLHPWNAGDVIPRLWINPWADRPLDGMLPFPSATASERGRVSYSEGDVAMGAVLGLPDGWPPGDPFPR